MKEVFNELMFMSLCFLALIMFVVLVLINENKHECLLEAIEKGYSPDEIHKICK